MSELKIAPSQSTAATQQADPSSGGAGSGSDFGPILQAASVSPGAASAQKQSQASTGGNPRGAARDTSASAGSKDRAPPKPERGSARGSTGSEQQSEAAVAACAAAAAGAANRADIAATTQNGFGDRGSSDKASASDPAIAVPGAALSDTSAAMPGIAANIACSAQGSPVETKASTPADPSLASSEQLRPDRGGPQLDRTKSSDATRSSTIQARDARTTTAPEDADADPQSAADLGRSIVPGSAAPAAQDARAAVQALSPEIRSVGATTADGAPSHSGATSTLAPPVDPAGTVATPAGGAFGNVTTTYGPEGRATVATPVGQPGFGQEFSERVVVLARSGVQSAQISLEPAGLGPVGVSIQVHGHEATLVFTAQHETTRSALEAALPRLREMFAECGMQLSDASVGGRAQPDRSAPDYSPSSSEPLADGGADRMGAPPAEPARAAAALRLVDTYA